jgi:hypothetical protein
VSCAKCGNGKVCATGDDCASGGCSSLTCARWAKRFGSTEPDTALAVALDSKGNILLGGSFTGQVTFGSNSFQSTGGTADGFVVKLSPSASTPRTTCSSPVTRAAATSAARR